MHISKLSCYLALFFLSHVLVTQAQVSNVRDFSEFGENVTYCEDEIVRLVIPSHESPTVEYEIYRIRGGSTQLIRPLDPSLTFDVLTDSGSALNSVQNGDGFYAIAIETATSSITDTSGILLFEIVTVDSGSLDPTLSTTIPYNTSPGLLSGLDGSTTSGTLSYQWQQSTDNITWSDIASATGKTYTPGFITSNTYFRREAISTLPGGDQCSSGSNSILISIPSTLSLTSSAASNTFCVGDVLTFTASGSTSYEFLVNGAIVQGPSAVQTYTTVLSVNSVVSIRGDTSSNTLDINMTLNELQAGSISGTQIICYGEPVTMNLITHGSVGGVSLTLVDTEKYQWQSSLDRVYWTDVPGGKSADLTITSLISSTFFRLNTVNTLNGVYCEAPSNSVEITVAPDLKGGTIDQANYILCSEDTPQELTVSGGSSGTNILHQWQKSTDGGVTYTDILFETNPTYIANSVSETTYFRRNTYSAIGSCTISSNEIKVTLNDISPGSLDPTQSAIICNNSIPPMISNGADGVSSVGRITYQWQQSVDNSVWTDLTSGTLSHYTPTQAITQTTWFRRQGISTVGTLTCSDTTNVIQFSVYETQVPTLIRKDVDDENHNIFQVNNLWYNNSICQGSSTTSTSFFVFEESSNVVTPTYEWKVTPVTAGVIDSASGEILWNQTFSGTVTISVRDSNCGGTSDWLDTSIEVLSYDTDATQLATPTIVSEAIYGLIPSEIPECQIEVTTPNTHFYTRTASGTSDYASIEWSLAAVFPGGGITGVTSPGSINSFTGEMDWNPGFWGTLDVVATPVNCDETQGPPSSLTINIVEAVDTSPAILVDITTPFPVCPTGGGETSLISSSDLPVVWSLNNPSAGVITSTDSFTGALTWDADFSGWVTIMATTTDPCNNGSSEIYVNVPGKASISNLSGGFGNVTLCQGTYLNGIEYNIGGFPTFANVTNLPAGITSTFSATHHVIDIEYTGTALNGQIYRLDILGQAYTYTVAGATETADEVVRGLANEITSFLGARFTATRIAPNTLRLRTNVAGFQLAGTVYSYTAAVEVINISTISFPERTITLTGTVTADPGIYDYTITTEGGTASCTQVSRVARFTVTGQSSISLDVGSDDNQEICLGEAISPITYPVDYAYSAVATDLPAGLTQTYSSTSGLIISGTPTENVTQTTVYVYTVETLFNKGGCSPEATVSGTITIHPPQGITLSSAIGTDNQTICNTGSVSGLATITYQLSGSTERYSILGLPAGIGVDYDPVSRIITITGSPSDVVTSTTVYPYSITTSGTYCSSVTLNGKITLESGPVIALTSPLATSNQIGGNQVCVGSSIVPIIYTVDISSSVAVTGLPNGVTYSQSGNTITISGTPNVSINERTRYSYIITTSGSSCKPEVSLSGLIDVSPLPFVDVDYITVNDINHISCNGSSDGSITIPADSPAFDLRIRGGQTAIGQLDRIVLTNQPELGDVYSITIDGNTYQHTVIASRFGGTTQTPEQVALALIDEINTGTGVLLSPALASFENPSGINLAALNPEVPFTTGAAVLTSYTGIATPTIVSSNVVSHVMLNYSYSWTGPNGFASSNLSISNLDAGVYNLEVTIGNCSNSSSQASFTIEEPDPIEINTSLCNGAFQATVTGGVAPYRTELYDSSNNLIRGPESTATIQNYTGLTPGSNYRLVVYDSECVVPKEMAIEIPFEMSFDASKPNVVNDFCNDSTGSGLIELGGNAVGESFSGGSGQFTYEWIGGPSGNFRATTRDIYNLEAGNYTVTVTDAILGCSDSKLFTIETVDPLVIDITDSTILNSAGKVDLNCNGDETAVIEVSVSGGLGNYSYAWTRNGNSIIGSNSNKIENIGAGIYTVTVSDEAPIGTGIDPCEISRTFEVVEPDSLSIIANTGTTTKTFCPDTPVNLDIQILGGAPPFNVTITSSNGSVRNQTISTNGNQTISGLNPTVEGNTYTVEVEDANGCESGNASSTVIFESIEAISVDVKVEQIDCKNGVLGSISLDLISGSIPVPEDVQIQWISADSNLYHTWATNNGRLDGISNGGKYNIIVSQDGCVLFETSNIEITDIDNTQLAVSVLNENSGSCDGLGRVELALSGGVTPYQIYWELYTSSQEIVSTDSISAAETSTTDTTTGTSTSTTTSSLETELVNQWVRVARLTNDAFATELEPGVYRAIVMDNSNNVNNSACGGTWVSRNFNIGSERFEVINFKSQLDDASCDQEDTTGIIRFELLNTIPNPNNNELSIRVNLDGEDITDSAIKNGNIYSYDGIQPGDHTLLIELTSGTTTPTQSCSAIHNFTIDRLSSIVFEGETEYELDVCEEFIELRIEPDAVTGGDPYIIDGKSTYDFEWQYTPESSINRNPQIYVGDAVLEAYPGTYELTISDQQANCPGITQTILVKSKNNTAPFTVNGVLQKAIESTTTSITTFDVVKALSPTCESPTDDGRIGIDISGGIKPYSIKWLREEINPNTNSATLVEISSAANSTQLYDLSPGKYKLEITAEGANGCSNVAGLNKSNYYEEYIFVPKNEQLYIIDGPFVDEDLCQGLPGRILIELYDNLQEGISFYYNNEIVSLAEDQPAREGAYILLIDKPVQKADLLITNKEGCVVSTEVLIEDIGLPEFEYHSPSLDANGTILAREEITFTNTSELPYSYSEWNFGDGTEKEIVVNNRTVSPTLHTYGVSGVYFVTLRNFNEIGCFEEITKQIKIGKGYNIIAPNIFSPNNDGINDYFRPLFSGFEKVSFRVYDERGNILYQEHIEESDPTQISGIQLQGWSGDNATGAPYYIYQFTGNLITDQTQIERTGTFVLIK